MRPIVLITLLFMGWTTIAAAESFSSIHGNRLLDQLNSKKSSIDKKRLIDIRKSYHSATAYTKYDKSSGELYYPKGWMDARMYVPSGVTTAIFSVTTKPNTSVRVHLIFVGSHETGERTLDHINPISARIKRMSKWDMKGTLELDRGGNSESITLDTDYINRVGGGWIYCSTVEDIEDPSRVADPESFGYTTTTGNGVSEGVTVKFNSWSAVESWIPSVTFSKGDPSQPAIGRIKVINKPSPTRATTSYVSVPTSGTTYANMADYLSGGGASSSSSISSSASSSSTSSTSSSSSSTGDGTPSCPTGYHWVGDPDFGECIKDGTSSSSSTTSSSSSSTSSSSSRPHSSSSSSSLPRGTCPAGQKWVDDEFGGGCMNIITSSASSSKSSSSSSSSVSSSSSSSSSSAEAAPPPADNAEFEVRTGTPITANEQTEVEKLLAGKRFAIGGSVLKDEFGTVVFITADKHAYIYKGVADGNVVWSADISGRFTGLYKSGDTAWKFGTLLNSDGIVGPEPDLAGATVPVIGYAVHYKNADKEAWGVIDENKTLYLLRIIDGTPYKIELFTVADDVMKNAVLDLDAPAVTFGGAGTSSAVSSSSSTQSTGSSSSSSVVSSSASSVSKKQACLDKGGSWDEDFGGCSL